MHCLRTPQKLMPAKMYDFTVSIQLNLRCVSLNLGARGVLLQTIMWVRASITWTTVLLDEYFGSYDINT